MPPTALFVLLGTLMCSIAATSALGPVGAVCDLTSRNSVLGMSGKEVFVQVQHHEAAVDTTTLQTITTATTQFDFLAPVSAKLGWAIKTFNDTARTQGVLRVSGGATCFVFLFCGWRRPNLTHAASGRHGDLGGHTYIHVRPLVSFCCALTLGLRFHCLSLCSVHAGNTSRVQSLTIGPDGALLVTLSLTSDNTIANDFGQVCWCTSLVRAALSTAKR